MRASHPRHPHSRHPASGHPLSRLALCLSLCLSLPLALPACGEKEGPVAPPRAVMRSEAGQYSIVPTVGQLPYCVIVEVNGPVARPLPISEDGQSADCDAAKPVAGKTFPLPATDDPFRAYVVFSDRRLNAATTATQIRDLLQADPRAVISPMDLRAPGQVYLEIIDIRPAELRPSK
ncbi:MAG: hypothetical protein R3F14_23365 [Polyangiaceae bacterium]